VSEEDHKTLNSEIDKVHPLRDGDPLMNLTLNWVHKRLPSETHELATELTNRPSDVFAAACYLLEATGRILDVQESLNSSEVKAMVGSGFLNLNPAVVSVTVEKSLSGQTHVSIRGTAKEGLIKQHSGEKAACRLAEQLSNLLQDGSG
jgi:hypothetical protein